ncbi:MAG TPA: glycosyltransferase family 87 protein [Anaerolineae bacterium]|nr:glycosyltransferase family 87 protein [Anaerolineae bacterium]
MRSSPTVSLVMAPLLLAGYLIWGGWAITHDKPIDFYAYYAAADALNRGQPLYHANPEQEALNPIPGLPGILPPYIYPPALASLLRPLARLTPPVAAFLWMILNSVGLVLGAWILGTSLDDERGRQVALLAMAGFVPPLTSLYAGQFNGLVWLGLAAIFHLGIGPRQFGMNGQPCPEQSRRDAGRRSIAAALSGIILGATILLKPLLWSSAIFFAWQRRWLVVLTCIAGTLLLVLVSAAFDGLTPWREFLSIAPQLSSTTTTAYPPNQSLYGFALRAFTTHEYGASLALQPAWAAPFAALLSLALVGATMALTWNRSGAQQPARFALWLITGLLVTPLSWLHHLLLALLPILIIGTVALKHRAWGALAACGLAYLLIDVQGLAWHSLVGNTLLLSLGTYGMLILWSILAVWLVRNKLE